MKLEKDDFIKEITFKTSRSGGSGGQNVNKVATKVELIFNVHKSSLFSETEKQRLLEKLANKLDSEGNIHIVSQEDRSQLANKENAIEKTILLLTKALHVQKKRKPTKVPKSVVQKRLDSKLVKAIKKVNRKKPEMD
ncbi:MAG TPA: alternative ribosome rescue aminoacyl-tRNA hydrolase ArfB [Pedobacter sp.]|nr:alternative ribosome rescue aminoacyl-tRNA hydrolase ArfB [Pedobacter sp.]